MLAQLLDGWGVLVLGLVVMWILQFGLTAMQMRRFYGRLRTLRQDGLTAVGMGGNRYKGRNYAVLVIDDDDRIVHAEKMTGWTIMAGLKPEPALAGMALADFLADPEATPLSTKLRTAFHNAANDLQKARDEGIAGAGPVASAPKTDPVQSETDNGAPLDAAAVGG